MPFAIFRRESSSDSLQDTILDTIFVVSAFLLCILILAVALLHCVLRRRNRQRSGNWTSCRALNVMSSSSPLAIPKDMEYAVYEVELVPNYKANTGRDFKSLDPGDKMSSDNDKSRDLEFEHGSKPTSCPIHLLVPLSAYPVFQPPK